MHNAIQAIITLLTASLTANTYKYIYYGPNLVPALAELPCVEVIPISESMTNRGTQTMMNELTIRIVVKDSLKKFVTNDTNKSTVAHVETFIKRIGERDSAKGRPDAATILGILHDNRQLTNTVHINDIGTVNYSFDKTQDGSYIIQADVEVTAQFISNRS